MKVRCIKNLNKFHYLTIGKIYEAEYNPYDNSVYLIKCDDGKSTLILKHWFVKIGDGKRMLNKEQRKFLEYIRDYHKCVGWGVTIPEILIKGEYHEIGMRAVLAEWKALVSGNKVALGIYGKPTKYLK